MSRAVVKEILEEIDALGARDRMALEQELAKRLEREWELQVAKARKTARRRKIDQAVIDQAIERRRYAT